MPTKHGGRQRPHLPVKRWITFGEGGEPALLDQSTPAAQKAADEPIAGMKIVEKPSAKEVVRDEIVF